MNYKKYRQIQVFIYSRFIVTKSEKVSMLKEAIMKNTFSIDFWFWALWNNLISLRCTIDITNLLIWMPNDAQCHFWALLGILRARHSILRCSVWAFFWAGLGMFLSWVGHFSERTQYFGHFKGRFTNILQTEWVIRSRQDFNMFTCDTKSKKDTDKGIYTVHFTSEINISNISMISFCETSR